MASSMITIDDSDSSVEYDPILQWRMGGIPGIEYHNTTHGSSTAGAMASFNFTGTSINVLGSIVSNGLLPCMAFSVGNVTFTYTPPINRGSTELFSQTFFSSPPLPYAPYALKMVISTEGVTCGEDTPTKQLRVLWVDYLEYDASPTDAATDIPLTVSMAAATTSGPPAFNTIQASTSGSRPTAPTIASSPNTPSHPQASNHRALIGGVIGGAFLLSAALISMILWLRRRRQHPEHAALDMPVGPSPFVDTQASTNHFTDQQGRPSRSFNLSRLYGGISADAKTRPEPSITGTTHLGTTNARLNMEHIDGGVRLPPSDQSMSDHELPPPYQSEYQRST